MKINKDNSNLNSQELGIYIHIPFCVQKCNYCDFLSSSETDEIKTKYIASLIEEMKSYKNQFRMDKVQTIFIGGGTPSILNLELLELLFTGLHSNFNISPKAEFTIECNPGTLNTDKVDLFKQYGVNRVSLGLQSTNNTQLNKLGRIHTYEEFLGSYELLRNKDYNNINIDLMSALPNQTLKDWEETLGKIVLLNPEHISAYSLIVEEGTKLFDQIAKEKDQGINNLPSEEDERLMYYITNEILDDAGYDRYEISNYARNGFTCKHNISYWLRKNYLGLGIGAASLINNVRFNNTNDLHYYLEHSGSLNNIKLDENLLSINEQMEEFMFLGLRLIQGVSKKTFEETFHTNYDKIYGNISKELEDKKLITLSNDKIKLTNKGIDLSNHVLANFLF